MIEVIQYPLITKEHTITLNEKLPDRKSAQSHNFIFGSAEPIKLPSQNVLLSVPSVFRMYATGKR
jgi:hypothetical protein